MHTIETINYVIMCLFFVCYAYQFAYIPLAWLPSRKKREKQKPNPNHTFAVLIAAHDEAAVIGALVDSLCAQTYPAQQVGIFVAADRCSDRTAEIARAHGAVVFERSANGRSGKGQALNFLLREMQRNGYDGYDAYIVLDADNVADPHFIANMNRTFSAGYDIVTCYRNSKNYGDNWISAGYGLWFLRESRYLNGVRMRLGSSCAVSGTGFLFSGSVLRACGGWHFFLLTEDIEFTIDNVVRGVRIGYCADAVIYDEQPVRFRQSWAQRLRWSRGYLQVFARYGGRLLGGIVHGSFSCYDMAMSILPAAVLTVTGLVINLGAAIVSLAQTGTWGAVGTSVLQSGISLYLTLFVIGAVTTVTEWHSIRCPAHKKIRYAFTFPLFMMTYLPIVIESLFVTPEWTHIAHTRNVPARQLRSDNQSAV